MSFTSGSGPIASAFVKIDADTTAARASIDAFLRHLERIDDVSKRAADDMTRNFRRAAEDSERALRGIGDGNPFRGLENDAERASKSVDDVGESSHKLRAGLGVVATGIGLVSAAAGAAGAAAVGFGLQQAAALEQTQIGFKSLLGSAEEADKFIREMQQFAATTPFEFPGLADNARQLLATGKALGITKEQIIPTITVLGDLVSVLGQPPESIDRIITAFAQMSSKGKVSTEELLQVAEALPGFPIFDAMAKGLGITTQQLQAQVSDGLIPADKGIQALLKGMKEFPGAAGAMAEQAQTLTGLFSTFKDTITLTLTDAFQPLVANVKTALGPLTEAIGTTLQSLAPQISSIATTLLQGITPIISTLGPAIASILESIAPSIQTLANALLPALAPLGTALSALGTAFGAVLMAASPILTVLGTLIGTIIPPLASIITSLTQNVLGPLIEVVSGALIGALNALAPALIEIARVFGELFTELGPVITEVATIFAGVFVQAVTMLAPVLAQVIGILGQGLLQILIALAPVLKEIAQALAERFLAQAELLVPVLPELAQAFVDIAVSLAQLLVALLPLLLPMIELQTLLIQKIGAPVLLLIAQALALVASHMAELATTVSGVLTPVVRTVSDVLRGLLDVFGPIIDTVIGVLTPALFGVAVGAIAPLGAAIAALVITFKFLYENAIVPLINIISSALQPVVAAVSATFEFLWNSVLVPLAGFITETVIPTFKLIATIALVPLVIALAVVIETFKFFWNSILVPLIGFIVSVATPMINAFMSVLSFLGNIVSTVVSTAFDILKGAISALGNVISFVWNTFITPLIDTLRDKLSGAADIARSAFDTFKNALSKVGDAIGSVIGFVNDLLKKLGELSSKLLNLPGAGALGNISRTAGNLLGNIPGFQSGGIITSDGLAMLHAPEVVVPLNDPARAMQLLERSGILETLATARPTSDSFSSGGNIGLSTQPISSTGIAIDTISVTINGNMSNEQAREAGVALVDSVEQTLARRRLALTARTV